MIADVLDLFAGPGGWSVALQRLGLTEFGVEWDEDVCRTARLAGHHRYLGDVRWFDAPVGSFRGLIASPPCDTFSTAGAGTGRRDLDRLLTAVGFVAAGSTPRDALGDVGSGWLDDGLFGIAVEPDDRSTLVLEPLRVIRQARPEWVALEQVPAVLPVWRAYGRALHGLGYSSWSGILHAEQYGVPQTRRRAILIASRVRTPSPPLPTHSRYYPNNPSRLDRGVLPWVTMADALSWGMTARPYVTVANGTRAGGADPQVLGGSHARAVVQREIDGRRWSFKGAGHVGEGRPRDPARAPAATITGKGTATWSVNDQSGTARDPDWPTTRPATTIAGRGLVADPGQNANRENGSTKSRNDGVRVSVAEAGVLQGFPADYPWRGGLTARHQQVGDAVPPPLAEAIVRAIEPELICVECGNDLVAEGLRVCLDCAETVEQPW